MLERASSCLESGGRQLLRRTRRCSKSRRMLHATFWHYAGGDLGLPGWWTSATPSEVPVPAEDRSNKRISKYRHEGGSHGQPTIALDFLYPAKTLAFIQHISNLRWDPSNDRRKHHSAAHGIRYFSSKSGSIQEFTGLEADPGMAQENEEVEALLKDSTPLKALQGLLQSSNDHRRERVVWRLYELVGEADRTTSLRADLLDHLASSKQSVDAYRLIQVFESLATKDRRSSSYRAAISAYLRLNMVGTAIKIHEEAAERAPGPLFGSNMLLARTIQDNQWDLAFKVCETFAASSHHLADSSLHPSPALWSGVASVSNLLDRAASLLQYAQQFAHILQPTSNKGKSLECFARGFFPEVIKRALKPDNPDDTILLSLFVGLQTAGLSRHEYYTLAIMTMLNHPKYMNYSNQQLLHPRIYSMFRQDYLDKSDAGFLPPGDALIRAFMDHLSKYRSFKSKKDSTISVDALVDDLRSFHARSSSSIGSSNLRFIMAMYARAGDKDKVYQFFNELKARSLEKKSQLITNEAVLPLLYVHARRVEPSATLQQFQRISEEFGLRPDIKAWNILLSVYARADDLEKALTCFDDFLASGIRPTKNTFGPVLDICARRGDVDAIEGLFSKAKSHNVPLEKSAFARGQLVLALVNDTDLTAAEKAAELMLKEKREGNLHGSMTPTLNFLITAYAQQQDVSSTMRIYKRYQEEGIALDSYTYAALMQSLILMRQTNAAYKILTTTMPNNNVQAHAFHYSLVIAGFLNEGQLHRAQSAQSRMEKRNVSHSPSSRMAFLRLKALSRFQALKDDDSTDLQNHLPRLEDVEAELRQSLKENDPSERSLKQPRQGLHQTPLHQATPDGYFEFLVLLYGTHGAYNMCKELFETAATRRQGNPDVFDAPVGLLTAVMEGHQRAREHAEVDKCWQLARSQVAMLTRLASVPEDAPGEDDPAAKIAQNRKHLLVRSTRIYFRDLSKRKGSSVIGRMRTIISSLLKDGYGIDNMTWNEYIQYLARTGYMLDAFTACEAYLMPSFVGWRFAAPHYLRKDPRGYLRMELRARDARKHIVMPRYKTLVIMAAALSYVRRQEDMGVELDTGDMVSLHTLRRIAPKTIRAIETMPVLPQEKLQRRFLMGPMAL